MFSLFSFIYDTVTIVQSRWMVPRWFSWWIVCKLEISYTSYLIPVCWTLPYLCVSAFWMWAMAPAQSWWEFFSVLVALINPGLLLLTNPPLLLATHSQVIRNGLSLQKACVTVWSSCPHFLFSRPCKSSRTKLYQLELCFQVFSNYHCLIWMFLYGRDFPFSLWSLSPCLHCLLWFVCVCMVVCLFFFFFINDEFFFAWQTLP